MTWGKILKTEHSVPKKKIRLDLVPRLMHTENIKLCGAAEGKHTMKNIATQVTWAHALPNYCFYLYKKC